MPGHRGRTPKVRGGGKSFDRHAEYSAADLAWFAATPRQRKRMLRERREALQRGV